MKNINEAKQSLKVDDFQLADDEIRNIFIDEAVEVLQDMDTSLPEWTGSPDNLDILSNIRRGFHTLKGSGRMVGANSVGEMAWSVERLLNSVLAGSVETSDDLIDFVNDTKYNIPYLINDFANEDLPSVDIAEYILKAENLRLGRHITDGFDIESQDNVESQDNNDSTSDDLAAPVVSEDNSSHQSHNQSDTESQNTESENTDSHNNPVHPDNEEVSATKNPASTSTFDSDVLKTGLFSDHAFNENIKEDSNSKSDKSESLETTQTSKTNSTTSQSEDENSDKKQGSDNTDVDQKSDVQQTLETSENDLKTLTDDSTNTVENQDTETLSDSENNDENDINDENDNKNVVTDEDDVEGNSVDTEEETEDDSQEADLTAKTDSKLKKETKKARVENPDYKKSRSNVTLEPAKKLSNSQGSKIVTWIAVAVIVFMAVLGVYLANS